MSQTLPFGANTLVIPFTRVRGSAARTGHVPPIEEARPSEERTQETNESTVSHDPLE